MNLCSDNHEEVCYEGRICPVCVLKEEIVGWEKDGSELQLRIDQLEEEKELAEIAAAEAAESSQILANRQKLTCGVPHDQLFAKALYEIPRRSVNYRRGKKGNIVPKLSEMSQSELVALRKSVMPRKTGGIKRHIHQHGQHKICPRCGGDVKYNDKIDMYECIWDRRCGWVGKLRA